MNRVLALVLTVLLAGQASAHNKPNEEPQFTVASPGNALTGYVSGDAVPIVVASTARIPRGSLKLTLNGVDVTAALSADAGGSLSGTVAGLEPGANVFELYSREQHGKHGRGHRHWHRHFDRDPVAQLTLMKAIAPALVCDLNTISNLGGFPVQPSGTMAGTRITQVTLTLATATLPEYCSVRGILEERNDGLSGIPGTPSYRTNQHYGTLFEVRLPTAWNGRYMFQGGGGTEGGTPNATGQPGGTNGIAVLQSGFVVAAQNGGHLNSELPASYPPGPITDLNHIQVLGQNMFFPDEKAVRDWAYNSIDTTTQTTKYLIDAYYGRAPEKSYFVGCSTSGRQGMAMLQRFPQHYDGVVAGDPFYLPPDISASETWGLQQIINIVPIIDGAPQYTQSFPPADQQLFTSAILAACDAADGLVDGVIDNAGCKFDPATFVWPSSGPYGSIAPGQPLQCTGAKTATCLTPAQVNATKKIAEGPRDSRGRKIVSPDGTPLSGYPFDGGFMQPQGIPTRDIGTATNPPGNIGLGSGQLPLFWFTNPDPTYNPLTVDYNNDIDLMVRRSPAVNNSTRIEPFVRRGGKLMLYHGLSDSGPPWPYTLKYFEDVSDRFGKERANGFMKMYLIPNMGHCSGNAATDRFDMLTPMVDWIENGNAPDDIVATGQNFFSTLGTLTGLPTTRSRPLCAYPKTLRYTGGDMSQASSYACGMHGHDHDHR